MLSGSACQTDEIHTHDSLKVANASSKLASVSRAPAIAPIVMAGISAASTGSALTIVVNTFGLDSLGQDLEFQVSPGTSIRDLKAMVEDRSGRDATKLFVGHLNPDDFMEMHSTECQDNKTVADYFQPGHDFFLPIQVATVATPDGEVSVAVDPSDRVCDLVRNLPKQEGTLRADGDIVSGSEYINKFALDAWSTNIDEVDGGGYKNDEYRRLYQTVRWEQMCVNLGGYPVKKKRTLSDVEIANGHTEDGRELVPQEKQEGKLLVSATFSPSELNKRREKLAELRGKKAVLKKQLKKADKKKKKDKKNKKKNKKSKKQSSSSSSSSSKGSCDEATSVEDPNPGGKASGSKDTVDVDVDAGCVGATSASSKVLGILGLKAAKG